MIKVNEIFVSFQGEGTNIGSPTVFVRLTGCNFRCLYCDTLYALDEEGDNYSQDLLFLEINKISALHKIKNICFTGGEPLIQQKELKELFRMLNNKKKYIEVETNGSIFPDKELLDVVNQWNVSFKMKNSGMKERYSNDVITKWSQISKEKDNVFFKFVIKDDIDLTELEEFIAVFNLPIDKIILMPEGINGETMKERSKKLFEKKSQYRIIPRLHILLYENSRKV